MTNLCLASKRIFRVLLLELRKFVPTNISTFTVIKLKLFRITATTDKNKNMTKHSSSHTPGHFSEGQQFIMRKHISKLMFVVGGNPVNIHVDLMFLKTHLNISNCVLVIRSSFPSSKIFA